MVSAYESKCFDANTQYNATLEAFGPAASYLKATLKLHKEACLIKALRNFLYKLSQ